MTNIFIAQNLRYDFSKKKSVQLHILTFFKSSTLEITDNDKILLLLLICSVIIFGKF
jgi:hypothetical protein